MSLVRKSQDSFITFFTPGMLFEALKFRYIGPIQGIGSINSSEPYRILATSGALFSFMSRP